MRSFGILFATLMVSLASVATPAREIPIFEETAVAGVADAPCTDAKLSAFVDKISDGLTQCATKTDYKFTSYYLATAKQREQLCSCSVLANELQIYAVPRCTVIKNTETVTLAASLKEDFQDCSFESAPAPDTPKPTPTPTPTKTPTRTPTPTPSVSTSPPPTTPTPTPSIKTDSSSGPPFSLLGGSSGGVAFAVAIAALAAVN